MIVLKLPIVALFCIVRWAIKATPETEQKPDDDGGTRRPGQRHPRPPRSPRPRRGPHGEPKLPPPARTRTVVARAKRVEH